MEKIELKAKKITSAEKKQLRFLVEDFLELNLQDLGAMIKAEIKMNECWTVVDEVFHVEKHWLSEIDPEDTTETLDKREMIVRIYELLKSFWDQFKKSLLDYEYEIKPARKCHEKLSEKIDNDNEWSQFKGLLQTSTSPCDEALCDISFKFKVSFEAGRIDFFRINISIISDFLEFLNELDASIFSQCKNCGKFIVITRMGKEFCSSGCAAKKNQKDKWQNDPVKMRAKEKKRYREKRKQSK